MLGGSYSQASHIPPPLVIYIQVYSTKNRCLVFENSFSPAVDSPRRPIKKEHTRLYVQNRCVFGGALKIYKALNALSPTPGTSERVRRGERDKGGDLARLKRPPARALTRAHDTRRLESRMLQGQGHWTGLDYSGNRTATHQLLTCSM